jgi:glycosyltransferase involved in cell wall biosynthesis
MSNTRTSGGQRVDGPLDIVVLGGAPWGEATNHPAVQTVRALTGEHRVLYICEDPQGSTLRHLLLPKNSRSAVWSEPRLTALSNAFSKMRAERVTDRLWIAPLRGLTRLLPLSYPEPIRIRSATRLSNFIRRETARIGMQNPILWFYWWFFPELLELPHAVSVYDNIDDHSAYDHNRRLDFVRRTTQALEERTLRTVDLAYALSPELACTMKAIQPRMSLQAPGIDAAPVTTALADPHRPRDVLSLPHPLIGYAGQIGNRIDWPLISKLADSRPEWAFAFVGGAQPAELASRPNLHFLPGRPYPEMMRAIREFDVGLVPWIDSPATRGAYSYKALDYLAAGKQVIATSLPFSLDLAGHHPRVVTTVRSFDDWDTAIAQALERSSLADTAQACVMAAHSRTTTTRAHAIVADIRASTGQPRA